MTTITTRQWLDSGRSLGELRTQVGRDLVRLRRGVMMTADNPGPKELHGRKIRAAAPLLEDTTYFGFESAALIHGLPLLNKRFGAPVVIRTGGGHGSITGCLHARGARLGPEDRAEVGGLRVTSLSRTVCDLVRGLPFPEAVIVADAGLARGVDRAWCLERTSEGRGCRMARRALEFADGRAESAGESLSRVRISELGLPAPELQHDLRDACGRFLGRGDFWWEEFGLVGEFDGKLKYGELLRPGQTAADAVMAEKQRKRAILDAGYRVVRWVWSELTAPALEHRLRAAMTPPRDGPSLR